MPRVRVLYFAALRELRGRREEDLDVPADTTLAQLYAQLFPPGPGGSLPIGFARNQVHVPPSTRVEDGDEVCFLPPLGGGGRSH